jgi:hypothetical protein
MLSNFCCATSTDGRLVPRNIFPEEVGVEWFSEAMYSVRRRKGTAMWL